MGVVHHQGPIGAVLSAQVVDLDAPCFGSLRAPMPGEHDLEITFGDDPSQESLPEIKEDLWDDGSAPIVETAEHEAGHVVALYEHRVPIREVTISRHVPEEGSGSVSGGTKIDSEIFARLPVEQQAACGLAGLYVEYIAKAEASRAWIEWVSNRPLGCGDDDERRVRAMAATSRVDYSVLATTARAILEGMRPSLLDSAQQLARFLVEGQNGSSYWQSGEAVERWLGEHRGPPRGMGEKPPGMDSPSMPLEVDLARDADA